MPTESITRNITFTEEESKKIAEAYEKEMPKFDFSPNPNLKKMSKEEFIERCLKNNEEKIRHTRKIIDKIKIQLCKNPENTSLRLELVSFESIFNDLYHDTVSKQMSEWLNSMYEMGFTKDDIETIIEKTGDCSYKITMKVKNTRNKNSKTLGRRKNEL